MAPSGTANRSACLNLLINLIKTFLLLILLGITFGGGACFVIGLGDLGHGGEVVAAIGGGVVLIFGWVAWLLFKSFRRPKDDGSDQGGAGPQA